MLIGFSLLQQSRLKISEEVDLFPQHAQKIEKKISNYILTLYGYGEQFSEHADCNEYCLYPTDLTSRNIKLTISENLVEIRTDWLGTFPTFYDLDSREFASHMRVFDYS